MGDSEIKLLKKSKWQYDIDEGNQHFSLSKIRFPIIHLANCVTSLDFNPVGETAATIDTFGAVVISDLDTDSCKYRMKIGSNPGKEEQFFLMHFLIILAFFIQMIFVAAGGLLILTSTSYLRVTIPVNSIFSTLKKEL